MKHVPLSILDLAPVSSKGDTTEALRNTTELARRAEAWGYQRFWVAEHHNMPAIASSSPAVLLAHLAAATSTIRVGSGGVMLPNHAPLVVAEQFGTLESLHPGRIDLGIGRAPGTDQRTALALRRTIQGLSAEDFPAELTELIAMLAGDPARLQAVPTAAGLPQVWLLGSSDFSARLAGLLGLPFSFAHHFSAANTEPALAVYRRASARRSGWTSRTRWWRSARPAPTPTSTPSTWPSRAGCRSCGCAPAPRSGCPARRRPRPTSSARPSRPSSSSARPARRSARPRPWPASSASCSGAPGPTS